MGSNQSVVLVEAFLTSVDTDSFTFEMCSYSKDGGRRRNQVQVIGFNIGKMEVEEGGRRRRSRSDPSKCILKRYVS